MKISPSCSNLTLSKRICIDQNQNTGTAKHRKHPETLMFCWQNIRENIITKNILINKNEIVIVISFFSISSLHFPCPAPSDDMTLFLVIKPTPVTSSANGKTQEVLKSKFTDQHRML